MKIEKIRLSHFRNYSELTLYPHESVNLFFGPNGSGKTNLLEAVHYCALGKSHRVASDQNVIQSGEKEALCRVTVRGESGRREIAIRLSREEGQKKTIQIDSKKIGRFSELMGCLQCVIFSPEDLSLIKEGPSPRRRYLDMMISQVNRSYFIALQQYRAGMEQRNAILKTLHQNPAADRRMLEDFENAMAQNAEIIISERLKVVSLLSGLARDTYQGISGREEELFQMSYHCSLKETEGTAVHMREQLRENREEDIRLGITSVGPHRDDLQLTLNRKNMKLFASQGQIRTAALSLKLAQMKALKQMGGESPVLLLDDVMSELDRTRRTRLLSEIDAFQTFITCTDRSDLEDDRSHREYAVSAKEGIGCMELTTEGREEEKLRLAEPDFSMETEGE